MMHAAYDPFLPPGTQWRDLFSVVVVSACKPDFFDKDARRPVYQIATEDGMLREGFQVRGWVHVRWWVRASRGEMPALQGTGVALRWRSPLHRCEHREALLRLAHVHDPAGTRAGD